MYYRTVAAVSRTDHIALAVVSPKSCIIGHLTCYLLCLLLPRFLEPLRFHDYATLLPYAPTVHGNNHHLLPDAVMIRSYCLSTTTPISPLRRYCSTTP